MNIKIIKLISIVLLAALVFCGCTEFKERDITGDDIRFEYDQWFWGISIQYGIELVIENDNPNYTYCATANDSHFFVDDFENDTFNYYKTYIYKSGEHIIWNNLTKLDSEEKWNGDVTHIDIVVKDGDSIVGLAVVRITKNGDMFHWKGELLKQIEFPKVNGEYQNVTEEYVNNRIAEIKANG